MAPKRIISPTRSSRGKNAEDYAGGGSDFPQEAKDIASPQRGMIDTDMGHYGAVKTKKTPKTVDPNFKHVSGGGSPGSYHGKKRQKLSKIARAPT
jgi:hypothetical protein